MIKKLIKPYIFVFLVVCLFWNWNEVSWLFSYRVVTEKLGSLFTVQSSIATTTTTTTTAEVAATTTTVEEIKEIKKTAPASGVVISGNSLEIEKIGIYVPLVSINSVDEAHAALDKGAVYYPTSALPGTAGQTVILGHSAPANWPMIKHDWIFSKLNDLAVGDKITVSFNGREITYTVTRTIFLDRGEELPKNDLTNSDNVLFLISCWPPGKDYKRIAVEAAMEI